MRTAGGHPDTRLVHAAQQVKGKCILVGWDSFDVSGLAAKDVHSDSVHVSISYIVAEQVTNKESTALRRESVTLNWFSCSHSGVKDGTCFLAL